MAHLICLLLNCYFVGNSHTHVKNFLHRTLCSEAKPSPIQGRELVLPAHVREGEDLTTCFQLQPLQP